MKNSSKSPIREKGGTMLKNGSILQSQGNSNVSGIFGAIVNTKFNPVVINDSLENLWITNSTGENLYWVRILRSLGFSFTKRC